MYHKIGSKVTSKVNAQGMTEGTTYTVIEATQTAAFLGGIYITYTLQAEGSDQLLKVGNGHLVLAAA
jgi:hypothetical protein